MTSKFGRSLKDELEENIVVHLYKHKPIDQQKYRKLKLITNPNNSTILANKITKDILPGKEEKLSHPNIEQI